MVGDNIPEEIMAYGDYVDGNPGGYDGNPVGAALVNPVPVYGNPVGVPGINFPVGVRGANLPVGLANPAAYGYQGYAPAASKRRQKCKYSGSGCK
ncbi:hypothetical protein V6N13_017079 [Hibiscus sabdariffa]|uniref:Uncharacterized protein n=1 Tax=Hibiscus sabdariffa TaxID=183260 RepID=A0ABR2CY99_9ROSI